MPDAGLASAISATWEPARGFLYLAYRSGPGGPAEWSVSRSPPTSRPSLADADQLYAKPSQHEEAKLHEVVFDYRSKASNTTSGAHRPACAGRIGIRHSVGRTGVRKEQRRNRVVPRLPSKKNSSTEPKTVHNRHRARLSIRWWIEARYNPRLASLHQRTAATKRMRGQLAAITWPHKPSVQHTGGTT